MAHFENDTSFIIIGMLALEIKTPYPFYELELLKNQWYSIKNVVEIKKKIYVPTKY